MARYDDTFVGLFLEPWNRHDVDGALALMTDDCVWEVTRSREPHGTLYTGQTAVRSAIVEAFKALPDVNYHPVRILSARTMSWWNSWLPARSVTAAKPGSTPATSSPSGTS